jgi:hypothetical protein
MHPTTIPFQRYEKSSQAVLLADKRSTSALGDGPSTIPTVGRALQIPRALHVPLLKDHLISAAEVAKKHDILFQGPHVYILPPGPRPPDSLAITRGHRTNGVYELHTFRHETASIHHNHGPFHIPTNILPLHRTFNHISASALSRLLQQYPSLQPPSHNIRTVTSLPCPSCFKGKQTRGPFRTSHTPIPSVLSRISTDLCGPLPLLSQGARYLQVVVDDKSHYTAGILLSKKSEAPSRLSATIRAWATTTGLPVKSVISDNAKELTS